MALPTPMFPSEPVVTAATIQTALGAVLALLVAFGVDAIEGKESAILGAWAACAPLVFAFFVRRKVTPV